MIIISYLLPQHCMVKRTVNTKQTAYAFINHMWSPSNKSRQGMRKLAKQKDHVTSYRLSLQTSNNNILEYSIRNRPVPTQSNKGQFPKTNSILEQGTYNYNIQI